MLVDARLLSASAVPVVQESPDFILMELDRTVAEADPCRVPFESRNLRWAMRARTPAPAEPGYCDSPYVGLVPESRLA